MRFGPRKHKDGTPFAFSEAQPIMARETKVDKLLSEIRGYAEVTNRRPLAGVACSLWTPVRPPVFRAFLVRRKLQVTATDEAAVEEPVLIKHVTPAS
jgi:hypothetical protein